MDTNQKRILTVAVALLVIVIVLGLTVVRPWMQNRTISVTVTETIERPNLNFAFSFQSGENAYSYVEPTRDASSTPLGPEAVFLMLKTSDYVVYQSNGSQGEAPRSMSIFVFPEREEAGTSTTATTTDRITKIRTWAEEYSGMTSINIARTTPEEVSLDGVKALHFKTDGLYPQDVYIAFYQNRFYLMVGQYDGESDPRYTDFQNLVKSVTFL